VGRTPDRFIGATEILACKDFKEIISSEKNKKTYKILKLIKIVWKAFFNICALGDFHKFTSFLEK